MDLHSGRDQGNFDLIPGLQDFYMVQVGSSKYKKFFTDLSLWQTPTWGFHWLKIYMTRFALVQFTLPLNRTEAACEEQNIAFSPM